MIRDECRQLTLHIGLPKAGSSTIQKFLHTQKHQLIRQSLNVPKCLGAFSHFKLALMFYSSTHKPDFLARNNQLISAAERLIFKARLEQQLEQELGDSNIRRWIISSEFLQHCLQEHHEIQSLSLLLGQFFETINILLYVRSPLEAATSMMSTEVKMGKTHFALEKPEYYNILCNHQRTITTWQSAFRPKKLIVRDFNKHKKENTLIRDFCDLIELDWQEDYALSPRANESLTLDGLKIISSLNKHLKQTKTRVATRQRFRFIDHVSRNFQNSEHYTPSLEQTEQFQSYYKASNDWLKQQSGIDYTDIQSTSLSKQNKPATYSLDCNQEPTISEEESLHIWETWRKNQEIRTNHQDVTSSQASEVQSLAESQASEAQSLAASAASDTAELIDLAAE